MASTFFFIYFIFKFFIYIYLLYFSPISLYPIGSYSLVPLLQLPYRLGRGEGREPCVLPNTTQPSHTASWHNARLTLKPAAPMCQRKHCPPGDRVSVHCARTETGVAIARWDKNIPARWHQANCAPPHGSPGRGRLQQRTQTWTRILLCIAVP